MKTPTPGTACAQLLKGMLDMGGRDLSIENMDHYSQIASEGSDASRLAISICTPLLPNKEIAATSEMAAYMALEAITDELEAKDSDFGKATSERYAAPLKNALDGMPAREYLFCWMEATQSDGWEYVKEKRFMVDQDRPAENYLLVRGDERIPLEEADQRICDYLLPLVDHWLEKLGRHLLENVSNKEWAHAYGKPTDENGLMQVEQRIREILGAGI